MDAASIPCHPKEIVMNFDSSARLSSMTRNLALIGFATLLASACSKPEPPVVPAPATTSVGTEIDDSVVTTRVKSALLADPEIKSFEIKVETRKGLVQLSGFVDSQARIDGAISLVKSVEGVKGVENGMLLKDGKATVGNTVDDSIVTTKIKSALLADPAVKSFDIAVVTRKGEVQLSGFVDNQTQIDRALVLARGVEGAQSIANEMQIKK
jgi:hyperosmotically inducible periplasmic protein